MDVDGEGGDDEGGDDEGGNGGEEEEMTETTDSMFATNGVYFFLYSILELSTDYRTQLVKKSTTQHTIGRHRRSKDKDAESTNYTISRKITQKHFTPRTRRLALISQSHIRKRTALGDAFPPRAPEARRNFILDLISAAAKESDSQVEDSESSFTDTLQRVLGSEDILEDVITFVS